MRARMPGLPNHQPFPTPKQYTKPQKEDNTMLTLAIIAAVLLAPTALLVISGPGEIPLMTTPKNLGLFDVEIVASKRTDSTHDDLVAAAHAATVPAGMRAALVDA